MERQEYVKKLREFVKQKGISIEHYFYSYAVMVRSNCKFNVPEFEQQSPFLTADDIKKLIYSDDIKISEYYAYAMSKAVRMFEQQQRTLSREDIKKEIETLLDKETTLPRNTIRDVLEDELGKKDHLSRKDIKEVVEEKLKETDRLPRKAMEEVVNSELDKQNLSRGDIIELVDQELEKKSPLRITMTSINNKVGDLLNGFAVVREKVTGRVHMYYHDAQTSTLTNEKVYPAGKLKVDSGYYVNFEEAIDRVLDEIAARHLYAETINVLRKDGKEGKPSIEEIFEVLKKAGAIRFGKDLVDKKIDTYEDLRGLGYKKKQSFGDASLTAGIYVRRDILEKVLAMYKAKVTWIEEPKKESHLK